MIRPHCYALAPHMTTIAIAVLMGIVVLLAGNLPWGVLLVPLNLRVATVVPWAVLPMAIYHRKVTPKRGPTSSIRSLPRNP